MNKCADKCARYCQKQRKNDNCMDRPSSARPCSARPQSACPQPGQMQMQCEPYNPQEEYRDPSSYPLITSSPTREIRATDNRRLLESGTTSDVQYMSPSSFADMQRGGPRRDECCPPQRGYLPGQTPPPKGCDCSKRNGLQHECRHGPLHDCREPRVSNYPYKYPEPEPKEPRERYAPDPFHHAEVTCDKCEEVMVPRPCMPAGMWTPTVESSRRSCPTKACMDSARRVAVHPPPCPTPCPEEQYDCEESELQQQMEPQRLDMQYVEYQDCQIDGSDDIITLPCPGGLVPTVRQCRGPMMQPIIIQGPLPEPVMVRCEAPPAVMVQCEAPKPFIVQGPTPKPFMVQLPAPRAVMLQYPKPDPVKVQCAPPKPFMLQSKVPKVVMQCTS